MSALTVTLATDITVLNRAMARSAGMVHPAYGCWHHVTRGYGAEAGWKYAPAPDLAFGAA
jgi:hypothetical protein